MAFGKVLRDLCEFAAALACGMLPLQTYSSLRDEQQAKASIKQYGALIPPKLSSLKRRSSPALTCPGVQTCTLLTKLPLELREMIYQEVLGNSQIHALSLPRRVGHIACQRQDHDHRRLCFSPRRTADNAVTDLSIDRLHNLYPHGFRDQRDMAMWSPPTCDFYHDFDLAPSRLPLLQSCHQTYSEAIKLLYTRNTFDFAHPRTFIWFTRTILPEKLALIVSLQLCLVSKRVSMRLFRLWDEMCAVVTSQLSVLKNLSVYLLIEHLHEAVQQDRMLRPLEDVRGLENFDIQLREFAGGLSNGDGETEVAASPFVEDLKAAVLQSRE